MIEFLTLLLGLSAGPQTIELSAGKEVREVRLFLEGALVATDENPPWTISIDLGADLRPRVLEAVSYDENGREVGRAEQRLNVPRPAAEARIHLERDSASRTAIGRVTWESSAGRAPLGAQAWLDGEPLDASDPSRIPLPAHDASQFHLIRVELEFAGDVVAEAQLAFGGTYLDEARTDLTALPVTAVGKVRRASPLRMTNWFRVGDEAAKVVAFEKGELDLVVVRGPGVTGAVRSLPGLFVEPASYAGATAGGPGISEGAGGLVTGVSTTATQRLQEVLALEAGRRLRLLLPEARAQAGWSVQMEVFALSPEIARAQGGLARALQQEVVLPGASNALRLADAVAVAGLQAAGGNRRRAVLLVLSEGATDESRHSIETVREYLDSLCVPLFVWRFGEQAEGTFPQWGRGERIDDLATLRDAARRMKEQLGRQRIAWLEGRFLLDGIDIDPRAGVQAVTR